MKFKKHEPLLQFTFKTKKVILEHLLLIPNSNCCPLTFSLKGSQDCSTDTTKWEMIISNTTIKSKDQSIIPIKTPKLYSTFLLVIENQNSIPVPNIKQSKTSQKSQPQTAQSETEIILEHLEFFWSIN